jgi:hypothetical protein
MATTAVATSKEVESRNEPLLTLFVQGLIPGAVSMAITAVAASKIHTVDRPSTHRLPGISMEVPMLQKLLVNYISRFLL